MNRGGMGLKEVAWSRRKGQTEGMGKGAMIKLGNGNVLQ